MVPIDQLEENAMSKATNISGFPSNKKKKNVMFKAGFIQVPLE